MSAALTCFQVPVHSGAHMYRHHETELQSSYSNDGYYPYLIDPEFPADADHTENFYDKVQYSRLQPRPGTSEYQDAGSGVVRYGRTMQNEEVPSPQLICPTPSLPPSQFPNQYLWSNWPSEAPMNVYQAYEPSSSHQLEYTHSSESPRAIDSQYSLENQHALVSGFYPAQQEFVEAGPNGISTPFHHGDSGYTQQPFLISTASFQSNQSNDLTTLQPRYYATHQPIPPEKCSSYSELAPNLSFMNNQAQPPLVRRETIQTQGHYTPKGVSEGVIPKRTATPSHDTKKTPYVLGLLNGPPLTSIGRKVQPPVSSPSHYIAMNNNIAMPVVNTIKTKSSRSVHDPRRSSTACTNIACGRPPDGSGADATCKQCARRSLRSSIKSTQPLVRSRACSKDPSSPLSLKRK